MCVLNRCVAVSLWREGVTEAGAERVKGGGTRRGRGLGVAGRREEEKAIQGARC